MKYNIAIVGSTGAVGRKILDTLLERNFPMKNLYLLASKKSEGKIIKSRDLEFKVQNLESFDFNSVNIAFSLQVLIYLQGLP